MHELRLLNQSSQVKRKKNIFATKKSTQRPGGGGEDEAPNESVEEQGAAAVAFRPAKRRPPTKAAQRLGLFRPRRGGGGKRATAIFAHAWILATATAAEKGEVNATFADGNPERETQQEEDGNDEETSVTRTDAARERHGGGVGDG